jgi:hypothetical protein
MTMGHSNQCSPRLLYDNASRTLWHASSSRDRLCIEASQPSVSLATLLEGGRRLTTKERRKLAVILSHSMLHFCDSPWLSKEWSKEHIEFFARAKGIDLERPYLTTNFEPFCPQNDLDTAFRVHQNPSVLALGILLLEIELCASIESFRSDKDLSPEGLPNVNTDLFTAERLLGEKVDDIYEGYKGAIQACLRCDFVGPQQSKSLEDEDFRQAVYEHIVEPLEAELYHACKIRPNELGLDEFRKEEPKPVKHERRDSKFSRSTSYPPNVVRPIIHIGSLGI